MPNIQIKGVSVDMHERIRRYAKARGRSLRDVVLEAILKELDDEAFAKRLRKRDHVELGMSAASLLDEARRESEQRIGS